MIWRIIQSFLLVICWIARQFLHGRYHHPMIIIWWDGNFWLGADVEWSFTSCWWLLYTLAPCGTCSPWPQLTLTFFLHGKRYWSLQILCYFLSYSNWWTKTMARNHHPHFWRNHRYWFSRPSEGDHGDFGFGPKAADHGRCCFAIPWGWEEKNCRLYNRITNFLSFLSLNQGIFDAKNVFIYIYHKYGSNRDWMMLVILDGRFRTWMLSPQNQITSTCVTNPARLRSAMMCANLDLNWFQTKTLPNFHDLVRFTKKIIQNSSRKTLVKRSGGRELAPPDQHLSPVALAGWAF